MSQTCPLCGALFSADSADQDFQAHLVVMHECPECRMRLSSEQERDLHLLQAHGKQWVLEEPLLPRGAQLAEVGGPLEEIPIPQDEEARCRWLYPFSLRIVEAEYPEAAWREVPEALQEQARYVEQHFASIARAMQNERYLRLKGMEAKACYLAKALALPEAGPAYANQKLGRVRCIE